MAPWRRPGARSTHPWRARAGAPDERPGRRAPLAPPRSPARSRRPGPPARRLRTTAAHPAPRADRRARAHRPVAEHERPQPRRRVRAPARALSRRVARGPRGAGRGGRRGNPPRWALEHQGRPHPADPPRARRRRSRVARRGAARRGTRLPHLAPRRRAQDRGVRAPVLIQPARRAGGHARLPGRRPARALPSRRVVRGGARRAHAACGRRPRRGLRAARRPHPSRGADAVPLWPGACPRGRDLIAESGGGGADARGASLRPALRATLSRATPLLDLPSVDVGVTSARIVGHGLKASADIFFSNCETVTFDSLRDILNPTVLKGEITLATGAMPKVTVETGQRILALLRRMAERQQALTDDEDAIEWGVTYLQSARPEECDMADRQG